MLLVIRHTSALLILNTKRTEFKFTIPEIRQEACSHVSEAIQCTQDLCHHFQLLSLEQAYLRPTSAAVVLVGLHVVRSPSAAISPLYCIKNFSPSKNTETLSIRVDYK
jgi:hypothetical protein